MPKYADPVISIPAMITMIQMARLLSLNMAFAIGMANMARPTPNQPIWVKDIMAEGSQEPFKPKDLRASRSRLIPVLAPT